MSENDQISGRQIAAARVLVGLGQAALASEASISVPTLRRMEASAGAVPGLRNNIKAVREVLEAYGVEFVQGGVALVADEAPDQENERPMGR